MRIYNLNNSTLLYYQGLYVKKLIDETWSYDNVIYEIINEGDAGEEYTRPDFVENLVKGHPGSRNLMRRLCFV